MSHPPDSQTRPLKVFPRRDLIRAGAVGAAGATALALNPRQMLAAGVPPERIPLLMRQAASATPEAMAAYQPVALTEQELATLRAVVGRLIPTDELGPGADEAGAHIYIDQALGGPDAALLPLFQAGLASLDAAAGEGGFASADTAAQDEILRLFETGRAGDGTPAANATPVTNPQIMQTIEIPAGFFATLLEYTRQGMFGDPVYGGNINFAGWDLIGYPGIKLLWLEEEQEINADVEAMHVSVEEFGGTGHE